MWTYQAHCVNVVDGDTYDLVVDLGFNLQKHDLRVRLLGADTPELRRGSTHERAEARRAAAYAESWLTAGNTNWPLTIVTTEVDSFGRWLAGIHRTGDTRSLSDALISAELAVPWPSKWRDIYDA